MDLKPRDRHPLERLVDARSHPLPRNTEPMPPVLFESSTGRVPSWRVKRYGNPDLGLICFIKDDGATTLYKVARWAGGRWDPSRWVPDGKVPRDILRQVVGQLSRQEVVQ